MRHAQDRERSLWTVIDQPRTLTSCGTFFPNAITATRVRGANVLVPSARLSIGTVSTVSMLNKELVQ